MKARIPIAISEWAARAIYKRFKANQGKAGKAEGGSRTLDPIHKGHLTTTEEFKDVTQ